MFDFNLIRVETELKNETEYKTAITSTTGTATGSAMQTNLFESRTLFISDPQTHKIEPVVLGTVIPILDLIRLCNPLNWDIQKIKELHPETNEEQIVMAFDYYIDHKGEIDGFLKDLAPELSIANAAQMGNRIIRELPEDMIDVDLGPGL